MYIIAQNASNLMFQVVTLEFNVAVQPVGPFLMTVTMEYVYQRNQLKVLKRILF